MVGDGTVNVGVKGGQRRTLVTRVGDPVTSYVMYTVDWDRGEVRPHSGFTVKTSPEAAVRPSEA